MLRLREAMRKEQEQRGDSRQPAPAPAAEGGTALADIRLQQEVGELPDVAGVRALFGDGGLRAFRAEVAPEEGPYRGARYLFDVEVPADYPYHPPRVHCATPVFHPNIDLEGHVCLNILREDWTPAQNLSCVLLGLLFLFLEPNPTDPLNRDAADLMTANPEEFRRTVRSTLYGGFFFGKKFPRLV